MNVEYERYFSGIVNGEVPVPLLDQPTLQRLREFVPADFVESLRPDAEYFLLQGFFFMVIHPIATVEYGGDIDSMISDYAEQIGADVSNVLDVANVVSEDRESDVISSTSAAIAVGMVAEQLQTGSVQIWGPRDDRN